MDVQAAQGGGAEALGVLTGVYSQEVLKEANPSEFIALLFHANFSNCMMCKWRCSSCHTMLPAESVILKDLQSVAEVLRTFGLS